MLLQGNLSRAGQQQPWPQQGMQFRPSGWIPGLNAPAQMQQSSFLQQN